MNRPTIFISYSHRDEDWKDRIVTHLGVSQQFELWDDRQIAGGEEWFPAITEAIDRGAIGIVLVSANSLTSNFILKEEIPRLLAKRSSESLRLYPIIIRPCHWKAVDWLSKLNVRPVDGRPLGLTRNNEVTDTQIDLDLAKIAEEIDLLVKQLPSSNDPAPPANDLHLYLHNLKDWLLMSDKLPGADDSHYINLNAVHWDGRLRSKLLGPKISDALTTLKRKNATAFIVGPPDSGKSVLLRQFARFLIGEQPKNNTRPIPVWIDLKPYRGTEPFEDYLWRWLGNEERPNFYKFIRGPLRGCMESGEVLWLLDGLDTRSLQEEGSPMHMLQKFREKYPANRYIFACRYDDGLALLDNSDKQTVLRLRELDDRQIEEFLRKMAPGLNLVKCRAHPDLLYVCRNPFRLRMLVSYWRKKGGLPSHLGHLYNEFLQDLIERAIGRGPEATLTQDLLSKIALALVERGHSESFIPREELRTAGVLQTLDDERRVDASIEGGLLIAHIRTDSVGFVDNRLQDCLAARALKDRLISPDGPKMIETCLQDFVLRETLANAVATTEDSSELVRKIVTHALQKLKGGT